MKSYSLDLRARIIAAVGAGESKTAVSKRYEVSRSTVKRYLKRQEQGRLAPSQRPGRQRRLDHEACEALRQQVETHRDWTLEQRAEALAEETGIAIKKSSVGNYLKRLGITHKKRALSPANKTKSSAKATSAR